MINLEYSSEYQKKDNYNSHIKIDKSEEFFLTKIIGDINIGAFGGVKHFLLNNYEEIRKRLIRERIYKLFLEYKISEINSNFYCDNKFVKELYLIKIEVTQSIIDCIKKNLDEYSKGFLMSLTARMYQLHKEYYDMLLETLEADKKILNDLQVKTKKKVNYS